MDEQVMGRFVLAGNRRGGQASGGLVAWERR
jgi:hypothetical protein